MHVGRNIKGSSFNVPSYLAHSFIVSVVLCHKSCKSNILQLTFFHIFISLPLHLPFQKRINNPKIIEGVGYEVFFRNQLILVIFLILFFMLQLFQPQIYEVQTLYCCFSSF
ncbi:hypothetical protein Hanom_Chr06g00574391 [Helianthus anomalus]